MAVDIRDLPPQAQAQVLRKLAAEKAKKEQLRETTPTRSKYGNVKTGRAALRFDSQKEAARYDQLILEQRAGVIRDLRLQVEFTLQAAYTTTEGERVRAIRYLADFAYYRRAGDAWEYVVEDVKSRPTRTRAYMMKKKLMADRLGLTIVEV